MLDVRIDSDDTVPEGLHCVVDVTKGFEVA